MDFFCLDYNDASDLQGDISRYTSQSFPPLYTPTDGDINGRAKSRFHAIHDMSIIDTYTHIHTQSCDYKQWAAGSGSAHTSIRKDEW